MNPHTFLRVLGPEDWNVCYVEPSIRPDDARYGINPNRVHKHTQFQVILKNNRIDLSKTSPLELFLGSLESLGIDTSEHDVRFVEDNWASPVLGAWGLGWEVRDVEKDTIEYDCVKEQNTNRDHKHLIDHLYSVIYNNTRYITLYESCVNVCVCVCVCMCV